MQVKVEHLIAAPFVSSLSFFNNKELDNLLGTSKTMHAAATEELRRRSLLKHIVLGEQDKAEALIQAHPKWLLNKAITADYSRRTIVATPFQAAIGAGDKPMWEMILRYLDPKEASRQFREWFPNGIEEDIPVQIDYNALALAILRDTDHGASAIAMFREQITAQKEIRYGKNFNIGHLKAAYQAYNDNFDDLYAEGTWEHLDLFWIQVIGFVQRQMTAYDAQIHCCGVQSVLENDHEFGRLLKLSDGTDFFSLAINSGLGFDFAVCSYYGGGLGVDRGDVPGLEGLWGGMGGICEKLCRAKTDALAGLRESLEQGMCYQP